MECVIYRARPGNDLKRAVQVITDAGLTPRVLDDARPDLFTWVATMGTMRIRIAVSDAEADAAAQALLDWEEQTAPRAAELGKQFERQALITLAVLGLLGGLAWFLFR